jgi:hypothetical protein
MQPKSEVYDRRQNRSHAAQDDDVDLDQREGLRRRNHRLPLRLWTEGRVGSQLDFHNCSNLSETGMFIETSDPYGLHELVRIEFNLPGVHEPVQVVGKVVTVLDDDNAGANIMGNGFLFERISDADRALIGAYVEAARLR